MAASESVMQRLDRALYEFSEDLDALGFKPRVLKSLALVLTTECNLRCGYCYADRKGRKTMSWEVAEAALDLMHSRGCGDSTIALYGGEPLLRPRLIRNIVDRIERTWTPATRPKTVLYTNGILLDRQRLRWIVDRNLAIQLSSDGVKHSQAQRGIGTFAVLDRLLHDVAQNFPQFMTRRLAIKLTLTAAKVNHLAESIRYFISLGIGKVDVIPLTTHDPDWDASTSRILEEQMETIRAFSLDQARSGETICCTLFSKVSAMGAGRRNRTGMCGFGQGTDLVVDVDGALAACSAFIRSFQSSRGVLHADLLAMASVGNILDLDDSTLISELRRRRERTPVVRDRGNKWSSTGTCHDCNYVDECFVCPASIAHIPGNRDPHRIPENQCAFNMAVGRQRKIFRREIAELERSTTTPRPPSENDNSPVA